VPLLIAGNINFVPVQASVMALNSKIRFFLISIALFIFPASCQNNKNDVIPDVYVYFNMDLTNDILFRDLTSVGNSVIVNYLTNNWGYASAGYDSSGVIVYRSAEDEFSAYDRTCPYDYVVNNKTVRVNVDFTMAVCPACSTTYALSAYGQPYSGPGRYPLKNYKTKFDGGRYVTVWNH
jgi:nitrite reductase/ring-hydroxylating ferredoxin subunit